MSDPCDMVLPMNKSTTIDRVIGMLDEMEYEMLNKNLVTFTLSCDYCPNTWEIDAPADFVPNTSRELLCVDCDNQWSHFILNGEDAYLDSYWESQYE